MLKKQLKGIVISDKMQKTVVVSVEGNKKDLKYKRRYKIHKKYKTHDEKEEYKVGDKIIIEECRPLSKDKKWRVIGPIKQATNKSINDKQTNEHREEKLNSKIINKKITNKPITTNNKEQTIKNKQ